MRRALSLHFATHLAITLACFCSAFVCSFSYASPLVIKFSHVVAENTPKGKAALFFKRLVEERSQGRVRVDVYPNSTLYRDREELEALQLGAVHMLAPSLAKFGPLGIREFEVFDLPFIFDSSEEMHRVTEGPIGQMLLRKLESRGILGLAYWDNGFKQMSANRPLHKPEDLRGLKMRIQASKVLDAQMRAVGAIPQVTAFSEVYSSLQTKLADGSENPNSNFWSQQLQDVQKYLTISDHGYLGYVVVVNRKFWEGLPRDIRLILNMAVLDATRYANEIARKENDEALSKIKGSGKTTVITLSREERELWRRAMLPAHQYFADKGGRELLEAIYKETGFTH